jgi:hypothetical protein
MAPFEIFASRVDSGARLRLRSLADSRSWPRVGQISRIDAIELLAEEALWAVSAKVHRLDEPRPIHFQFQSLRLSLNFSPSVGLSSVVPPTAELLKYSILERDRMTQ